MRKLTYIETRQNSKFVSIKMLLTVKIITVKIQFDNLVVVVELAAVPHRGVT